MLARPRRATTNQQDNPMPTDFDRQWGEHVRKVRRFAVLIFLVNWVVTIAFLGGVAFAGFKLLQHFGVI